LDNSSKYGIDTNKVCIAGISGGGHIVAGATNLLIKSNQFHRVKALFIHTGMLTDENQNVPMEKLEPHERDWGEPAPVMTTFFKLLATDFEN
jgi:acetyl esterase/lipase